MTKLADSVANTGYGRIMLDGTVSRPLGGFGFALTGAGGSSVGNLPIQRAFFLGGLHTVRGQFAKPVGAGRVGDAFWLGRAELARSSMVFRPVLFYDVGWAGSRDALSRIGRPMSGAGFGFSLLDGFVRVDVSRGIHPEQRWRGDIHLGARF
jgi:hemolysin activation/secretion protein